MGHGGGGGEMAEKRKKGQQKNSINFVNYYFIFGRGKNQGLVLVSNFPPKI